MKIVEDSPARLVLKESALNGQIAGAVFIIIGLGGAVFGILQAKVLIAVGAVFAVVGLLALLTTRSDVVTVDKAGRQVTVAIRSLLNRAGSAQTFGFDDILNVEYDEAYRSAAQAGVGGTAGTMASTLDMTLNLKLKTGERVSLGHEIKQVNPTIGLHSNPFAKCGVSLAQTIGVEFQQVGGAQGLLPMLGELAGAFKQTTTAQPSVAPVEPAAVSAPPISGAPQATPAPVTLPPAPTAQATPLQPVPTASPVPGNTVAVQPNDLTPTPPTNG